MSEYKSPINVTFDDISNEVINRYDNEIIYRVKKITEIDVDKERLINALLLEKNLVHCKDCKHWIPNIPKYAHIRYKVCNHEYNDGLCEGIGYEWDADDFCSRGEQKDEID